MRRGNLTDIRQYIILESTSVIDVHFPFGQSSERCQKMAGIKKVDTKIMKTQVVYDLSLPPNLLLKMHHTIPLLF
jgi:hypothetical protein